jgi:DNA-directed RNA polymerase beta subunit
MGIINNEWDILDLYFKNHRYPFTGHHLDSYREFIKNQIPFIVKSYNPITMIKYNENKEEIFKIEIYVGGKEGTELSISRPIIYEDGCPKLITPYDARMRNLTYETHLFAEVSVNITSLDGDRRNIEPPVVFKNVAIGSIPIMLHSDICILKNQGSSILSKLGECPYDTGGYFIIDGKEKVIIAQEKIVTNKLFVSALKDHKDFTHKGIIRCVADKGNLVPTNVQFYFVRNPLGKNTRLDKALDKAFDMDKDPNRGKGRDDSEENVSGKYENSRGAIYVSIPSFKEKVPLFILFRAIGVQSDKEICKMIFGTGYTKIEQEYFDNLIRPSIIDARYFHKDKEYMVDTQQKAIDYLKFSVQYGTVEHVKMVLSKDFFPNIESFENKKKYLGYLTLQFIKTAKGLLPLSDRDSYIYKRVDISGFMLAELFQEAYTKMRDSVRNKIDSEYIYGPWKTRTKDFQNFINPNNIYKIIDHLVITQTFAKSLKGQWGLINNSDPELGKVQDLSRISYIGFLSHTRRVNMPIDRSIKVTEPHKLHSQQWGIMCPYETPDGASIGYLKNLAILAKITAGVDVDNIKRCLEDIGVIPLKHTNFYSNKNITNVFVNGTLFGITGDPLFVSRLLKAYRRNGLINILISISFNITANEIRIFTEAGRPCRPLLILKYNQNTKKNEPTAFGGGSGADLKNWFDLLNGTYYKLDNKEKNDDYYYIDKYIDPLGKGGGKKGFKGGSGGSGNALFENIYSTIFPSSSASGLRYGGDDTIGAVGAVSALGSTEYNSGNTIISNNLITRINKNDFDDIEYASGDSDDVDDMDASEGSDDPIDKFTGGGSGDGRRRIRSRSKSEDTSSSDGDGSDSSDSSSNSDDGTDSDEEIKRDVKRIGNIHRKKYMGILKELEATAACIEYLDSEEADTSLIAMNTNEIGAYHTHLEIHPSSILSVVSGNIPMSNHNSSARNVFHAAQSKQAIGIYATNFNKRFDTMSYILHYPQRPIINTRIAQYTSSDYMANGYNTIVAIMTYSGFNQEDSIMINKATIDRGLNSLSYYKSITATAKIISQNEKVIFGNPILMRDKGIKIVGIKNKNYEHLDANGFIKEGTYVPEGQEVIIVGMINVREVVKEFKNGIFTDVKKELIYTDISISTDNSLFGKVDRVYKSDKIAGADSTICKVRFLKIKKPEFGDKHCSRHGQKGVIGMVIPEENMPYTKDGVRPDIIINPHAIPSRMTIGHLVECIFAKLCCIDGVLGDASVFIPIEKETIYSRLKEKNFNKYGNEILYNGYTGAQIDTEIFIGPTYYFRLKHMVAEKINSRGVGKVMGLTRQPTEGRRKGGGLRIGEMERDTVLSHGISNFIKESMMERSDKFCWCICKRCGTLVAFNMKENINLCKNCNNDDVAVIHTPYAFKLFIQELETMGIQPRLNTEFIDMPIDQAELVRISNAGDADEADDNDDDDRDNANADTSEAIDDALFNSQIDNFATKNTIIDEKVWKDTYDNNFDKIKGGGMYEDYEEDVEDDEDDDMDDIDDDDEDEAGEDERIQEGGDDDDDEDSSSSVSSVSSGSSGVYGLEESEGGSIGGSSDSSDSDNSDGEEIWNDDTDPNATVEAVAKTVAKTDDKTGADDANAKTTGGGSGGGVNSDIKELFIEM